MACFEIGDIITPKPDHYGFYNVRVIDIFKEKKGKNKGKEYYKLEIMNGVAIIPVSNESNYKLLKRANKTIPKKK